MPRDLETLWLLCAQGPASALPGQWPQRSPLSLTQHQAPGLRNQSGVPVLSAPSNQSIAQLSLLLPPRPPTTAGGGGADGEGCGRGGGGAGGKGGKGGKGGALDLDSLERMRQLDKHIRRNRLQVGC